MIFLKFPQHLRCTPLWKIIKYGKKKWKKALFNKPPRHCGYSEPGCRVSIPPVVCTMGTHKKYLSYKIPSLALAAPQCAKIRKKVCNLAPKWWKRFRLKSTSFEIFFFTSGLSCALFFRILAVFFPFFAHCTLVPLRRCLWKVVFFHMLVKTYNPRTSTYEISVN